MTYSIGEVSNMAGISISTLRFYDKEGLFPKIERSNGGIRMFSEKELEIINMIECLKSTGMPIKDIRRFFDWCDEGDASLEKRRDMFNERLEAVNRQIEELQKALYTIKYKCWYYERAVEAGSEDAVENIPSHEIPKEIQVCKENYLKH